MEYCICMPQDMSIIAFLCSHIETDCLIHYKKMILHLYVSYVMKRRQSYKIVNFMH